MNVELLREGLELTVVGILVVFVNLGISYLLIRLIAWIGEADEEKNVAQQIAEEKAALAEEEAALQTGVSVPAAPAASAFRGMDPAVLAAITAAIRRYESDLEIES